MRRAWIAVLVSLVALTAWPSSAPAAAPTGPPLGLIVQVSSLPSTVSPAGFAQWLDRFCRTEAGRSHELVLQDVAAADGALLTPYLDAVATRAPGGSRVCLQRLYVGTVETPWRGPGSPYVEGVLDAGHRALHLARSRAVAAAFVSRYPRVRFDWYLGYEANLNELADPGIASAYQTLLAAELRDRAALRPGRAALWSPAFWFPHHLYASNMHGMTALRSNLARMFAALERAGGGLTAVDLQEYIAPSSCQPSWNQVTVDDVRAWVAFADELTSAAVRVNVERFSVDCATGGLRAAPLGEVWRRERAYTNANVPLGDSFEIRYWATQTSR